MPTLKQQATDAKAEELERAIIEEGEEIVAKLGIGRAPRVYQALALALIAYELRVTRRER